MLANLFSSSRECTVISNCRSENFKIKSSLYSRQHGKFKIDSLSQRSYEYDVCFIAKIVMGQVDSSFLRGSLRFHVSQRRARGYRGKHCRLPVAALKLWSVAFLFELYTFNDDTRKCSIIDHFSTAYHGFKCSVGKVHISSTICFNSRMMYVLGNGLVCLSVCLFLFMLNISKSFGPLCRHVGSYIALLMAPGF